MSKQRKVFTDSWARSVRPGKNGIDQGDAACAGLRLVVSGHKRQWRVRLRIPQGRLVKRELAAVSVMTVAEARVATEGLRSLIRLGADMDDAMVQLGLRTEPQAQEDEIYTLAQVLDDFLAYQERRVREGTYVRYKRYANRAKKDGLLPPGSRSAKLTDPTEVTRAAAKAYVEPVHRESGHRAAGQMLATLRAAFNVAIDADKLSVNPFARWPKKDLSKLASKIRRGHIPLGELHTAWQTLTEADTPEARVGKLCLLTGARSGEIAQCRWSWVADDSITIPKEVAKQGVELVHLLSEAASSVLQVQRATLGRGRHRYVFPADTVVGHVRQDNTTKHLKKILSVTAHDLRRTVRTALKQMGCPPEVRDRITCHATVAEGAGQLHYEVDDLVQLDCDAREWLEKLAEKMV